MTDQRGSAVYLEHRKALNRTSARTCFSLEAKLILRCNDWRQPRKSLLWITAGIPSQIHLYEHPHSLRDRAAYRQDYIRAIRAEPRQCRRDTIDARGLDALACYQPGEADGTWRRIQVRVKRDGASSRHRAAYLAVDAEDSRDNAPRESIGIDGSGRDWRAAAPSRRNVASPASNRRHRLRAGWRGIRYRLDIATLVATLSIPLAQR